MLFRQLFDRESCTYTYLLANSSDAIMIDPVIAHVENYIQLLAELNLKLVAVMDTHVHADHVTGSGKLSQRLDCLSLTGEKSGITCASKTFHDNEVLSFGDIELTVLYTPGHTDDSYCFLMEDRVFTGDTLFIRGTGRTDFQNGSAAQQFDSIQNRLFTLPDNTLVYPGHDYNGMTVSTIGEEKKYNPRLKNKSKSEYVTAMDNLNLPNPKMMDIAVPANKKCGLS